jgi:hypothetical protein
VSEETIRAFAGHVSRKMLERYSHIRLAAKQAAIPSLHAAIVEAAVLSVWLARLPDTGKDDYLF